ncbi:amidohydrolase family protein [soil metagenome]
MPARRAYRAARVFTGDSTISPGTVVLRGERIEWIGGSQPPSPVSIEDLGDATILPGLVNAHTHPSIDPAAGDQIGQMRRPLEVQLAAARRHVTADLSSGVTTMRVMGEEADVDFRIHREISAGALDGPDLVCAGVQIARAGHHGHAVTGVRSESEVAALARRNIERGARVLKIFATGGISTSGTATDAPPFSTQEIGCAAAIAHESGIPLAAHAHGGSGARQAVAGGVDTIEHAAAIDDECLEDILGRGLLIVGTFSILYHPRGIEHGDSGNPEVMGKLRHARETMERSWRAIVKAGARVAVGTDSMHGLLAYDIARLVEFGMPPLAALRAATVGGAEACGLTDRGRLVPGSRADILAVRGDPLADISRITDPILVVANGQVIRQVRQP